MVVVVTSRRAPSVATPRRASSPALRGCLARAACPPPSGNKLVTAGALFAFACVTFSAPILLTGSVTNPLWTSPDNLPVAAVRRGAFMNSGSKDVGLDATQGPTLVKRE